MATCSIWFFWLSISWLPQLRPWRCVLIQFYCTTNVHSQRLASSKKLHFLRRYFLNCRQWTKNITAQSVLWLADGTAHADWPIAGSRVVNDVCGRRSQGGESVSRRQNTDEVSYQLRSPFIHCNRSRYFDGIALWSFPALRPIYHWQVTILWVNCQPTRRLTWPFIPRELINECNPCIYMNYGGGYD